MVVSHGVLQVFRIAKLGIGFRNVKRYTRELTVNSYHWDRHRPGQVNETAILCFDKFSPLSPASPGFPGVIHLAYAAPAYWLLFATASFAGSDALLFTYS